MLKPVKLTSCIALLLAAGSQPSCAGVFSLAEKWPRDTILKTCLYEPIPTKLYNQISAVALDWTQGSSIRFDLGDRTNYLCKDRPNSNIRIIFSDRSWSATGRTANKIRFDKPTMSLLRLDADDLNRPAALREFGHALGFLHEEQNSRSSCRNEWANSSHDRGQETEHVAPQPPHGEAAQKQHVGSPDNTPPPAPDNGKFVITDFDKLSVMRVYTHPRYFRQGEQSKCYAPAPSALSEGDKLLMRTVYPPKPPDVSGEIGNQAVIRLEGPLAAEHYSYIVQALFKNDLLELRKTILTQGTVNSLITSTGVTIRGVVPDELGRFLCSLNLHSCSMRGNAPKWTATVADKNHIEDGAACPNTKLSKSIVCLPNVRIESYTVSITTNVKGGTEPLRDIVVGRYRGCNSWDTPCKTLVSRMNSSYNSKRDPELNLPGFSGKLQLPAEAYRVVITFRNDVERKKIEAVVSRVKAYRAKALGLDMDEVSIAVTYPLISVEAEQAGTSNFSKTATGLKPPMSWASALDFRDEFWKLAEYNNVDVAVWDHRVDKNHCGFTGNSAVIFDTPAKKAAQVLPPERASACPTAREKTYSLALPYDHGTAVAGIISGIIAGESSYYGVKPRTPIWAYELAHVDQLNQGGNPVVEMYRDYPLKPKVINISLSFAFGYNDSKSNVESYLFSTRKRFGLDHTSLIVAAAGATRIIDGAKKGEQIDNVSANCTAYPACWGNVGEIPRALISVVALNASGTDLLREEGTNQPLSNYGMAFDVSAVGETSSLLHGGYIGQVRGSSFAAPFITGLAALIYSKAQNLGLDPKPIHLKNRILATADKFQAIEKASRFGRVNFWKAMSFDKDLIRFKTSATCMDANCWMDVSIDRDMTGDVKISDGYREAALKMDSSIKIPFSSIFAIRRQANGKFTVIYTEGGGKIRWISSAALDVPTTEFVSVQDKSYPFNLDEIEEYVACSFKPDCPE